MLVSHRLPLNFDPERLQQDLCLVHAGEWVSHFNKQDYDGGWSGVSLRSAAGVTNNIVPMSCPLDTVADTPVLDRCLYLAEVLKHFHCPIRSARLLSLSPGSFIREHRDYDLGIEDGEVRIHVPIATNPGVGFYVNAERLTLNPGETWYIDFNLPHRVCNQGTTDRVHLVIDCLVNDWFQSLLPPMTHDERSEDALPSPEEWHKFQAVINRDIALQEELRDILDRPLFVSHIMKLGAARGFRFAATDVQHSLADARRLYSERLQAQCVP